MSSNSILYYPSIEFASEEWVKSSLLLWDHVYRIVPENYKTDDSPEIQVLVDEGLVRNIILEKKDVSDTCDEFLNFCETLAFLPAGLEAGDDEYARIHTDKIDERLYGKLAQMADVYMKDDWLKVTPELARGYMFYLAKHVAKRRNFVRGTDDTDIWSIAPFYTEDANFNEFVAADNNDGFYTSLYLNDLLPAHIGTVSSGDIIKFVKNRKDEKAELRTHLDTLNYRLLHLDSVEQIKIEVNDYIAELIRRKDALKESMDFAKEKNLRSALFAVGFPTSLTTLGAIGLAGNPFNIVNLASSVAVGGIAGYASFSQAQNTVRDTSHLSYLIAADKQLQPGTSERMMRSFEEFLND
jgi:hypothetical protein